MIEVEASAGMPEGSRKGRGRWTAAEVEARLVEALGFLRRMPDRERGWLAGVGTMSLWRQASPTLGMSAIEYVGYMLAERDQAPRLPGLTTDEVERMGEALGWMDALGEDDRRIMGKALAQLVAGRSRVDWGRVVGATAKGRGKDGARMRYRRGLEAISARLNGRATVHQSAVNPNNLHGAK